jgi:hypothetical protein
MRFKADIAERNPDAFAARVSPLGARQHYIQNCLPGYLCGNEKQGLLPPSFTQLAIAAIQARTDIPKITKQ